MQTGLVPIRPSIPPNGATTPRPLTALTKNSEIIPAAAACRLDDHRVADGFAYAPDLRRIVGQLAVRTGHTWHAGFDHGLLGRDFVAHHAYGLGRGPDEHKTAFFDTFRKVGVFAQKTVAGVNRLGTGLAGGIDDALPLQVTVLHRSAANVQGLIASLHMGRLRIGI